MTTTQQPEPDQHRIVIHHLSDLHFQQTNINRERGTGHERQEKPDPLVRYRGYLQRLPPERRPNLIVITGDLTATGDKHDLTTIATILRTAFPEWYSDLASRIFIVPGPRDVSWELDGTPSLSTFYDTFHDFALPSRAHNLPDHGTAAKTDLPCIAYPLDTCYTLDEFRADLKDEFHRHAKAYHGFVKRYSQVTRATVGLFGMKKRKKEEALASLRDKYLKLTEGNRLTLLDAGRIAPDDLTTFTSWISTLGNAPKPASGPREPLKILITHHPLAVQPESDNRAESELPVQQRFRQVMKQARDAGFHLALHGHIHKPQVLSDLSILEGADKQHPLRQIGAGSLGDDGMFNEITAVYSEEQDQHQWRLEIRTVNILAARPDNASSLVLLNPTEAAAEETKRLKRETDIHNDFDSRVRLVMRQFSEIIYRSQADDRSQKPLPQSAMQAVEAIIREVVFKDHHVRVRLLLKEKDVNRVIPRLKAAYLTPPTSDGPGSLTYPASIAAWSLVLGRTLVFPGITEEKLTQEDLNWLKRSDKVPELMRILEALHEQALARSYPSFDDPGRYEVLQKKLNALKDLKDSEELDLHGSDFYQIPPTDNPRPSHPHFACVPFPMRPQAAGYLPDVPEIAVLNVAVQVPEKTAEQRDPPAAASVPVFTSERLNMLLSLAELVGMILTTSSALGKPKGGWDDRVFRT